jgi:hypothetical protein
MSLQPHFYSTMWGVWFFSGILVAGFAALALATLALQRWGPLGDEVTAEHRHDLGKLLYAFVLFWAYIAFSQYFVIWNGDLPEETSFYRLRQGGPWGPLGLALMVGHFALPFVLLMPRGVKRRAAPLALASAFVLAMHHLDLVFHLLPALRPGLSWVDAATWLGLGAVFVGSFLRATASAAPLPVGDPRLPESLAHENF